MASSQDQNKVNELLSYISNLDNLRSTRLATWLELSRWIAPHRGVFYPELAAKYKGKRNSKAFTSVPSYALQRAAAGLTAGMTPREQNWFEPQFQDVALQEFSGALAWLDDLDKRLKAALNNGGFYQAIHSFNTDLLWAGCALLLCESDLDNVVRYECIQIGSFSIGKDTTGKLESVARKIAMSPYRIKETFPSDTLPSELEKLLDKNPFKPVEIIHLVRPRKNRNEKSKSKINMPYESYFIYKKELLHEGGYNSLPFFFTTWHDNGSIYGTGCGDDALPDSKMLHEMESQKLLGLGKLINPPVQAPASSKGRVALDSGSINYLNEKIRIEPVQDLSSYATVFQYLQTEIRNVSKRIENELQASTFSSIPLDQRPRDMSATEFLERKREALQLLGPVVQSYEPNVLTPLLYRTASILDEAGLLPIPPESLQGLPLLMNLEYISPIAMGLKQSGADATLALINSALQIAQVDQSILDKVDLEQAIDELATGIGCPGRVIRSDQDVQMLRQQKAMQQMAMQEQQMQMQTLATADQALANKVGEGLGDAVNSAL